MHCTDVNILQFRKYRDEKNTSVTKSEGTKGLRRIFCEDWIIESEVGDT